MVVATRRELPCAFAVVLESVPAGATTPQPTPIPNSLAAVFVRDGRPGDTYDGKEGIQAGVVIGLGRVKRLLFGDGGSGDHQVRDSPSGRAASADDSRGDPAEQPGCLGIERQG